MLVRLAALATAAAFALGGCSPAESDPTEEQSSEQQPQSGDESGDQSGDQSGGETETIEAPEPGLCRVLEPADIAEASNDTEPVDCAEPHNAETFLVASFGEKLADAGYDDERLGQVVYDRCSKGFMKFTGANESLALRSVLSWAWWRPTEEEWDAGARWFRCDVVGGTDQSAELVELPKTAKGVLLGIPGDTWMACVQGDNVSDVPPVPCTEPHDWRAVTTIVVGQEKDEYPGDRLVEVLSRDYCSDSVGAWMNYPVDYEFAYTWFHKAEWEAGNRRSICWAGTKE